MKCLNVGCGGDYREGWVNLDSHNEDYADVIFDLNDIYDKKPLPFDDYTFDKIILYDVLEHLPNPLPILNEIYRVCKNYGIIKIKVPYGENTFGNPDHKRVFYAGTFNMWNFDSYYYCVKERKNIELVKQELFILPTKSTFKKIKYGLGLPILNKLIKKNPAYLDLTLLRFFFQGMSMLIVFKKCENCYK